MHLNTILGTSLMVQWLRLCASTAWGQGINPWLGNQDPGCCMAWPKKKKKIRNSGKGFLGFAGLQRAPSCPTLCDSLDYTVHGTLQARILEWVAFPFARGSSRPGDSTQVSHIAGGFFTSWATREAPIGLHDSANVKDLCPSQWYRFSIWNVSGSFQSLLSTLLSQFRSTLSSLSQGISSF